MNTPFSPQKIVIAGAGTMGSGIAQVFALGGSEVILYDLNPGILDIATKEISKSLNKAVERGKIDSERANKANNRITFTNDINKLKANLILEAIIEVPEVKMDLFGKLEEINDDHTVFASNTSSIPITQLAAGLKNPGNFLGIHFFNPAPIMKLVEVVSGIATKPDLAVSVYNWLQQIGKIPVMAKDSPGFIVNRVARQFYTESLKSVEENAASIEQVDRLMEATGFKMGPFKLMDLIGVDTNHKVTTTMFEQFFQEPRFRPSRLQKQYVDAGYTGKKNGKGFYEY
ncbi:MAG: 3-hydroxyacyl-CoA dehydrogenase NAD-binding domain-containing protein [Cyclobacteriaceae bacterium]|nr:3-hydroxyacyl-CoA dehydrogenase NAD-binding domain-containing protein [Cyclobacteriaceae bacterium]